MSESSQNGRYYNNSNENNLWLHETFADIYKNRVAIQEKEIRKKYNRARKYTCNQYMPYYIAGNSSNKEFFNYTTFRL